MDNVTTALLLLGWWQLTGRGLNLCLLVLSYYIAYLVLWGLTVDNPLIYYAFQATLDTTVILFCCVLAYRDRPFRIIPIGYALVVFTSLLCDGLKLLDEAAEVYLLTGLHIARQQFSIPIDVIFAVVGSNGINRFLYFGVRPTYTKRTADNSSDKVN